MKLQDREQPYEISCGASFSRNKRLAPYLLCFLGHGTIVPWPGWRFNVEGLQMKQAHWRKLEEDQESSIWYGNHIEGGISFQETSRHGSTQAETWYDSCCDYWDHQLDEKLSDDIDANG